MEKEFIDDLEDFGKPLKEYLQIQLELEKLSLLKKLSRFGAYLFKILVVVYFSIIIVAFLLGALAVWYGKAFDNYFTGVLIAGAGLLLVAILLILMRKKIVLNSALANLSDILFNDEEK